MLKFTNCRACKKQIYLCVYPKTGKTAPIEVEPSADGNLIISGNGTYRFVTAEDAPGDPKHVSHFARCPAAKEFRQRGG